MTRPIRFDWLAFCIGFFLAMGIALTLLALTLPAESSYVWSDREGGWNRERIQSRQSDE